MPTNFTFNPGVELGMLSAPTRNMLTYIQRNSTLPDLSITSGHRTIEKNRAVGGSTRSQHLHGNALDIPIAHLSDEQKSNLLAQAIAAGAKGIGIYKGGKTLHIDTRSRPDMWGANPGAPYDSVRPEAFPAWAQPHLAKLAGAGGGAIPNPPPLGGVYKDIDSAATMFGVSPALMRATAWRESRLRPGAKNPNSSAGGLFQFTDATWNSMAAKYGALVKMPEGTSRYDQKWAAVMAAALTKENSQTITQITGTVPTDGELYAAHFLGASGAARLIRMGKETPNDIAANYFEKAAVANPSIFYDKDGNAQPISYVYKNLTQLKTDGMPMEAPAEIDAPAATKTAARVDSGVSQSKVQPVPVAQQKLSQAGPQVESEIGMMAQRFGLRSRGLIG
jgi:hypothetical protein